MKLNAKMILYDEYWGRKYRKKISILAELDLYILNNYIKNLKKECCSFRHKESLCCVEICFVDRFFHEDRFLPSAFHYDKLKKYAEIYLMNKEFLEEGMELKVTMFSGLG